ncbi:hypothetical protein F1654_09200 [Alkalicaulis satelles]|uniref:Uncharacterized protein n=1 Tax=Alkalicaulis satelles TaxID=2609175 RepID=A0A5M6ZJV9_9PROT|nr:hypothetical protein [Alkalicaulis satelles]KAA5803957.1 hypothetical protein F1654_09200 [Alkalicaulis satelles]
MRSDAPLIVMEVRRSPFAPTRTLSLYRDRMDLSDKGSLALRIDLAQVTEVRLTVEPAPGVKGAALVVCRVRAGGKTMAFASRRLRPDGGWSDESYAFRRALTGLHDALRPRFGEIAFREGPSLRARLILSGTGAALAAGAVLFSGFMLFERQAGLLAVIGLPFALTGGAITWMFRPRADKAYDPDALIQRFSG